MDGDCPWNDPSGGPIAPIPKKEDNMTTSSNRPVKKFKDVTLRGLTATV